MLRDFIGQAGRFQQARFRDWSEQAKRDALVREARAARRLRLAIGNGLIALGERIAERPGRTNGTMDRAA